MISAAKAADMGLIRIERGKAVTNRSPAPLDARGDEAYTPAQVFARCDRTRRPRRRDIRDSPHAARPTTRPRFAAHGLPPPSWPNAAVKANASRHLFCSGVPCSGFCPPETVGFGGDNLRARKRK